jgi:hypothetical protein
LLLLPVAGTLFVNGCMTNFERNLDIVASPAAIENAWGAPYSDVSGWVTFLARFRR